MTTEQDQQFMDELDKNIAAELGLDAFEQLQAVEIGISISSLMIKIDLRMQAAGWPQDKARKAQLAALVQAASWLKYRMGIGQCQNCHKQAELHKVKYADESGIGSMLICAQCNEV